MSRRYAALMALVVIACELAPEVGPPLTERCVSEDSDTEASVDFDVQIHVGIIMPQCLPCHDPAGEDNTGFLVSGLDLTSVEGLRRGGSTVGADIVRPGDHCESGIIKKVSSGPPFGNRMPFDGPPFLDPTQLRLLADWIAEGAEP